MVNRRRFISDSMKILLGASVGAAGTEYAEGLLHYGSNKNIQQPELAKNWWMEQPINPNGNFSEGGTYWKGGYIGSGDAKGATAGIRIFNGDHGEAWLDNPDTTAFTNTALIQAADDLQKEAGIHFPTWVLRTHHLMLEADVRVDFDEPYSENSWTRVAIATWIQRTCKLQQCTQNDLSHQPLSFNINGNLHTQLYTEYDVYRRNFPSPGYNAVALGANVNEYPADQLPLGY
jgi:hypothetical protein